MSKAILQAERNLEIERTNVKTGFNNYGSLQYRVDPNYWTVELSENRTTGYKLVGS